MASSHPQTPRAAILTFYFADRLKAEIMLASRLLPTLMQLDGLEKDGARLLYVEFLKGLEQEINLGRTQIDDPEMVRVSTVMTGILGMADSAMFADLQSHFTWMTSVMATYAQRAMEFLVKEKLL